VKSDDGTFTHAVCTWFYFDAQKDFIKNEYLKIFNTDELIKYRGNEVKETDILETIMNIKVNSDAFESMTVAEKTKNNLVGKNVIDLAATIVKRKEFIDKKKEDEVEIKKKAKKDADEQKAKEEAARLAKKNAEETKADLDKAAAEKKKKKEELEAATKAAKKAVKEAAPETPNRLSKITSIAQAAKAAATPGAKVENAKEAAAKKVQAAKEAAAAKWKQISSRRGSAGSGTA
jgi:septal ring factor EnvC (AmiA/AmiB activator)